VIRPFSLNDMPLLNRYRDSGIFLDSVPTLTWGRIIIPGGAVLSPFSSLTGVFTSVVDDPENEALIGQVVHSQSSPFAHFTFLAPLEQLDSPLLPELLENLITRIGARGANSLIAEVDVDSAAFRALKEAGFSVYSRQRIWRVPKQAGLEEVNSDWRAAENSDAFSVNLLCGSLVPGLIQQVEPTPWDSLSGQVLYQQGELRAYADIRSGPQGTWMQPFAHLDMQAQQAMFGELFNSLERNRRQPIFVCVRSYQDHLEPVLLEIGAEQGPQQAVMVKRTTRSVRSVERKVITEAERRRAEPSTPIRVPWQQAKQEIEWTTND
jgi:hypothetical protein